MSCPSVPRHDARMRIFKRMRILASARAIYAAEGREGLSLRKVGDAAGLSAPALYRYYSNKEMLVDALAEHASIELTNRMRRSLGSPTPVLRLERATRIVLEYGMRYPRLIALLLTARQPASGPLAFLRARVDECVRAGSAPSIGARWDGCSPRTRATSRCATESPRRRCRPAAAARSRAG